MNILRISRNVAAIAITSISTTFSIQVASAECGPSTKTSEPARMELTSFVGKGNDSGPLVDILKIENHEDNSKLSAIGIRFRAGMDSQIDYGSIRFRYGMFKIDITDRIRECFDLTGDILVNGTVLPEGSHKLNIEVADTSARIARYTVKLRVL